jgi:hypothetical protein
MVDAPGHKKNHQSFASQFDHFYNIITCYCTFIRAHNPSNCSDPLVQGD